MRGVARWAGYVAAGLFGLIVVAVGLIHLISNVMIASERGDGYDGPVADLDIPYDDEDALARGEHLVNHIAHCTHCHGGDLGGDVVEESFLLGRIAGPNLTGGDGGFVSEHSTEALIRAIRYGADSDGEKIFVMPSSVYFHLSDEDLAAMVAYIETGAEPIDGSGPTTRIGPMLHLFNVLGEAEPFDTPHPDEPAPREELAESDDVVEQGHYLALTAGCVECHGGDDLDGGEVLGETAPPLNANSRAAHWEDDEFIETIRTGVTPGGQEISEVMAWEWFAGMTDDELLAILEYMRSVDA